MTDESRRRRSIRIGRVKATLERQSFERAINDTLSASFNAEFRRMVNGDTGKASNPAIRQALATWMMQCPKNIDHSTRLAIAKWILDGRADIYLDAECVRLESELAGINETMRSVRLSPRRSQSDRANMAARTNQLKALQKRKRKQLQSASVQAGIARERLMAYVERTLRMLT